MLIERDYGIKAFVPHLGDGIVDLLLQDLSRQPSPFLGNTMDRWRQIARKDINDWQEIAAVEKLRPEFVFIHIDKVEWHWQWPAWARGTRVTRVGTAF